MVEQLVRSGVDLAELREVTFYSYARSVEVGQAMREAALAQGFAAAVRDPMPNFPGQWSVICRVRGNHLAWIHTGDQYALPRPGTYV